MNIKILISCHKKTKCIENSILQPIQLGCALSKQHFENMIHDDEGTNISEKNPMYCELTAQYWAWKNLDADYYGFCHYRRYFNFSDKHYPEDDYGVVREEYLDENSIKKYGFDEETIKRNILQNDIIITKRQDVRNLGKGYKNIFAQYDDAQFLNIKDLYTILEIIKEKYPNFEVYSSHFLNGHVASFCNMYILKKDIFFEYCEWLFPLLEEFCNRTDMSKYSTEALRTPGHLSERLFGIYYLYLIDKNPDIKVKELQCVFFEHTSEEINILEPAFNEKSVPVVFAANNGFVPVFAACLQSIIEHTRNDINYDFVLLNRDINKTNKMLLKEMVAPFNNISLRFFDVCKIVSKYKLKANAHISIETYYRFLAQEILKKYDKIIYLDCDIIVNYDIYELYKINIDGYMLAATRDPDFLGQINGANKETIKYCYEKLHMKDPYNYFQAGVLLFNTKEMKRYTVEQWLTFSSHPYLYNDQDVLNLYCEGKIKYLDMSWNVLSDCDHYRVKNVISYAPYYIQNEYKIARLNPKIIHFAGFMKPWYNPTGDFAMYFWKYLRKTIFYEQLLYNMCCRLLNKELNKNYISIYNIIENNIEKRSTLRKIIDIFLSKGTKRREFLKMIAGKRLLSKI